LFQEDHHKHSRKRGRSKRAILSFVGQLSKTIFGTATMDDVNILTDQINALTTKTIKLSNIYLNMQSMNPLSCILLTKEFPM